MNDATSDRAAAITAQILEAGLYLYLFFMFLSKGESIRNVIIFGGFSLWLTTLRKRADLAVLKSPITWFLYSYLGTIVLSSLLSIDVSYSFLEVKDGPLKCALLFPVIATTLNDERKLRNAAYACFCALIVLLAAGYYSFLVGDTPVLRPLTTVAYAYYNRFAGYLNTLLPIIFTLFLLRSRLSLKIALSIVFIVSLVALVLSTSRGGYLAFAGIALVWMLYLSRRRGFPVIRIIPVLLAVVMIIGVFSYLRFPEIRGRIDNLSADIGTFNLRTELWGAAYHGFLQSPVSGWGYGGKIFHMEEPFNGTPYATPPERGEHNMFLTALFHQGILGFIPFVLLVLTATITFWKEAYRSSGMKSAMLLACASIFLGNYILHAQLESMFKLQHYGVVLGLGMAAMGIHENSDS